MNFPTSEILWSYIKRKSLHLVFMASAKIAATRMSRKGQITVPKKVKENLGAVEGDYIIFLKEGNRIYVEAGQLAFKSKK